MDEHISNILDICSSIYSLTNFYTDCYPYTYSYDLANTGTILWYPLQLSNILDINSSIYSLIY